MVLWKLVHLGHMTCSHENAITNELRNLELSKKCIII